uniref:Uncharacterized protein n=1 Tax=Cacopsylla melanoneura TaxID=428564 RepID=A0A8D8TA41_9HEMI
MVGHTIDGIRRWSNCRIQIICPLCKWVCLAKKWPSHGCSKLSITGMPRKLFCPWMCPEQKEWTSYFEKENDLKHQKQCFEKFLTKYRRYNENTRTAVVLKQAEIVAVTVNSDGVVGGATTTPLVPSYTGIPIIGNYLVPGTIVQQGNPPNTIPYERACKLASTK